MNIRVSEYIARTLQESGATHVFLLTGGGAMYLNDAFAHTDGLTPVFCHHEQAAAMAAEGFARISGQFAVVNVTSGPGGINALNGVFGAWTDSIPMIVISGQIKRETSIVFHGRRDIRQLGDQEADIISMVSPITKYAASVLTPESISYHLEHAVTIATTGRPGPVWLDIPIDVQSAFIDLPPKKPSLPTREIREGRRNGSFNANEVLERLFAAKRPVILAGSGVRHADACQEFLAVIEQLSIPVVTAWTHDTIPSNHRVFSGRAGSIGTRPGNFAVQNADVLLVLGSRLNIRQIGYNWHAFAPKAFKIQVDVDPSELSKPTIPPDQAIECDLKFFLRAILTALGEACPDVRAHKDWLDWCQTRNRAYPPVLPHHRQWRGALNPYHFVDSVFSLLRDDDIIVCGNATACIVPFQVARLKTGQRMFSNSGSASMGYDLPAAIGAWFGAVSARGKQSRIICFAGDGSLQLNIQELQTVKQYRVPIKILLLNNNGYLSIRTSQQNFFKRLSGANDESGLSFPDYVAVSNAYGIQATKLDSQEFLDPLRLFLESGGPGLLDVQLDPNQLFEPRVSSRQLPDGSIVSAPLEDMFPFLAQEERESNMIHD